jgi:aspartyl-tRNA(Asn)/glutamyl-tRNA(Gln) amidotransferase subunit A
MEAPDPVGAVDAALRRAAEPALAHAFITLTARRAHEQAAASARRHARGRALGPLDGVPVAIKDLLDVAGTTTTAGSAIRRDLAPAAADAPAVAHLAAAGMVCVGKTNLSELAYSGLGLNPHFGTPRNPHDGAGPRVPGGSSSGSAVAVAAGAVDHAVGTDTSGSVRIPAALCGVVGFRPTAARIDRRGVFPLAPTLDSVGPLATTVAGAIALDQALRGVPVAPVAPPPPASLELVVPQGELLDDAEPEVRERVLRAADALAAAGARIVHRPVGAFAEAQALMDEHGTIVVFEARALHETLLASPDAQRLDRRVRNRLTQATTMTREDYEALLAGRARLQAELAADLGPALTLFPTVRHTAPALAPLEADDDEFVRVNLRTLRSTMLGSYLDMPGITLPVGTDRHGLPIGLLLSAPAGDDDRLLAAALAVEAALGYSAGR